MTTPFRAMRWRAPLPDPAACLLLSRALGLRPATAQLLYNRGLTTPAAAADFLAAGRTRILDPFLLRDMDRAVALIRERIASGRPIMIYGDYDADGVTGTTILLLALRALGARVDYYIPDRFTEGYGLNLEAVREIHGRGFDFILSVDTGVTAVAEAEEARRLSITLVVSDHHEPGPELPDADAIINPKRTDCSYPFKGLSGVGVAFKLALALAAPNAWELLDIVTLGTIADMVPLVGENRAIVREGLAALGSTRRPGLRALMEVAGVREPVTSTHVGFALGPRINALGRMGSAMAGVELLVTDDPVRARELARHLDEENRARQEVEAEILQAALAQARAMPEQERSHVLVLAGEGWHHGVVGICANRVLKAYYRPTILLAVDGEEVRGSARSIPGFHMHRALLQVSDLFTRFGGHAAAAGMTLRRREDLPELRRRLNEIGAQWLRPEDLIPELTVDAEVDLEQISQAFLEELQALEPHGIGNPEPVFALRGATLADARTMGREQQHLRLQIAVPSTSTTLEAVGWGMAAAQPERGMQADIAFRPELERYQGRTRLRLTLKDLHLQGREAPGSAGAPELGEAHCLAWDPLAGLGTKPAWRELIDARDEQLAPALAALAAPLPEAAATAAPGTEWASPAPPEATEPTRLRYVGALAAPAGSWLLVLTAGPWSAASLYTAVAAARPDLRGHLRLWLPGEPEPPEGAITVAPLGAQPAAPYTDTLLYHPPYHAGQVRGDRIHLLWERGEFALAETALGWAYPDREALVALYRLVRAGAVGPERLAAEIGEAPGPWSRARLEGGLTIFREMGLLTADGHVNGGKFELESSAHYRRGEVGRRALADSQSDDWPAKRYAI